MDILNEVWYKMGIDLITNLPETPECYNTIVGNDQLQKQMG